MSQGLWFHSPSGWGTVKVLDFSLWHVPWLVCLAGLADGRIVSARVYEKCCAFIHLSDTHFLHDLLFMFINMRIRICSGLCPTWALLDVCSCSLCSLIWEIFTLIVFSMKPLNPEWQWVSSIFLFCFAFTFNHLADAFIQSYLKKMFQQHGSYLN